MVRNRQIKADFWSDEKVGAMSRDARLMFIGLWNFADDSGICRANPVYIKNQIFPYDNITTKKTQVLLTECSVNNLIKLINYNDEQYLEIINFTKHQLINRPSKFRYIHNLEDAHDTLTDTSLMNVNVNVKENVKENDKKLTELQNTWNQKCARLSKVIENSDSRKVKEKIRLEERPLAIWVDIFTRINNSDFCCGKNDRKWKASYDWIMSNELNAIKVLEHKYDDKKDHCYNTPLESTHNEKPMKREKIADNAKIREIRQKMKDLTIKISKENAWHNLEYKAELTKLTKEIERAKTDARKLGEFLK